MERVKQFMTHYSSATLIIKVRHLTLSRISQFGFLFHNLRFISILSFNSSQGLFPWLLPIKMLYVFLLYLLCYIFYQSYPVICYGVMLRP